jgi:hypothetical protein
MQGFNIFGLCSEIAHIIRFVADDLSSQHTTFRQEPYIQGFPLAGNGSGPGR